jgi:hypothetical protein
LKSSRSTVSVVQPQAGNSKMVDIAMPSLGQEGEGEDEWYEVPVHRVTVRDRQNGVSHSFEVPEVNILSTNLKHAIPWKLCERNIMEVLNRITW